MDGEVPQLLIFLLLILVLLVLFALLRLRIKVLRKHRKARKALEERVEITQKITLRFLIIGFLAIMGTIIIFLTIYAVGILTQVEFSKFPFETQILWILNLLVSFSVGVTEIVVAWLLSRT
jgi:hypothetical protein